MLTLYQIPESFTFYSLCYIETAALDPKNHRVILHWIQYCFSKQLHCMMTCFPYHIILSEFWYLVISLVNGA